MDRSSSGGKAWFRVCLAALLGATVAAASAYWLHNRALDELLARLDSQELEKRKHRIKGSARHRRHEKSCRDVAPGSPNSLPEMSSFARIENGRADQKGSSPSLERLDSNSSFAAMSAIPAGLPRVQTRREGRVNVIFGFPPGNTRESMLLRLRRGESCFFVGEPSASIEAVLHKEVFPPDACALRI